MKRKRESRFIFILYLHFVNMKSFFYMRNIINGSTRGIQSHYKVRVMIYDAR